MGAESADKKKGEKALLLLLWLEADDSAILGFICFIH